MTILRRASAPDTQGQPVPSPAPNFAARAGRWSAAHWKTAAFGWLGFVAVAFLLGIAIGSHVLAQSNSGNGESGRASKTLAHAGFKQPASETVLVQGRQKLATDPAFRSVIAELVRSLAKTTHVTDVRSPLDTSGQISGDGHAAIVRFEIVGKTEMAKDRVAPALAAVAKLQRAHPGFSIREAGDASADRALSQTLSSDFKRAERLALPITLLIMLLAFGALVAAGLPVLLAFSGVIAAIGVSAILSHLLAAASATNTVILLVGMAVGVDYSLFYLKREREERAAGHDAQAALQRTASTSGEAVLISGATVLVAVAGMLLSGDPTFESIGLGTMVVVACAIVGSLTVLPALMHKLGDRVEKGRIPLVSRLRGASGSESRVWGAVLDATLRHPAVSAGSRSGCSPPRPFPPSRCRPSSPRSTTCPARSRSCAPCSA
jgi:uncharacterized membrane protein YdfJ with MMPL/SSD domain